MIGLNLSSIEASFAFGAFDCDFCDFSFFFVLFPLYVPFSLAFSRHYRFTISLFFTLSLSFNCYLLFSVNVNFQRAQDKKTLRLWFKSKAKATKISYWCYLKFLACRKWNINEKKYTPCWDNFGIRHAYMYAIVLLRVMMFVFDSIRFRVSKWLKACES